MTPCLRVFKKIDIKIKHHANQLKHTQIRAGDTLFIVVSPMTIKWSGLHSQHSQFMFLRKVSRTRIKSKKDKAEACQLYFLNSGGNKFLMTPTYKVNEDTDLKDISLTER